MPTLHTYKGYKITVRESQSPPVAVFDPIFPKAPALFKAKSLDLAMQWVDKTIKEDIALGNDYSARGI